MCAINKKQVDKLNRRRLLLENKIEKLCSKLNLDKDYKHIVVYLDMNIDSSNPVFGEWIKLRNDILLYDEDVSAAHHKINYSGLSLPKQFIL